MHTSRYVVLNQGGQWKIVQGGRRFSGSYPSKGQAMSAAIEFAERDGDAGCDAKVLVRHEDGRFMTEWMLGSNPLPVNDLQSALILDKK